MAYKRKKPKCPSEHNGLLTTVKAIGPLPGANVDNLSRSEKSTVYSDILDEVDNTIQMMLYRIMHNASGEGMIIVVDHSVKTDKVSYTMELYLGKPSPVLTQIFREQAKNIDIEEILFKVEEKRKIGEDDEE